MSAFQMISLAILGAVVVGQFVLPMVKLGKPSTMKHIEAVLAIKESSTNPKVTEACTLLLQALLG
jgi:hypothetical protein